MSTAAFWDELETRHAVIARLPGNRLSKFQDSLSEASAIEVIESYLLDVEGRYGGWTRSLATELLILSVHGLLSTDCANILVNLVLARPMGRARKLRETGCQLVEGKMEAEGLEVVLSPLQLAAILENDSIDPGSCLSNRFWGAASVVGGAIELVGAAGLLLVPEPTTVTKISGGILAAHGADTVSAGVMQVVSCQTRTTLTSQAVAAAAKALGADPNTAGNVGFAIDVGVPMAAGFIGAARAIAIRRGAVSLAAEEGLGGHTIARHVGRTEAELKLRLTQSRVPVASTFHTLRDAERAVAAALRANKGAIKAWSADALTQRPKAFRYAAGRVIGHGVVRSTGKLTDMSNVVVVLKKVTARNRIYFVLTAFPEL